MSTVSDSIVSHALYWASPDPYRLLPEDFKTLFEYAGCEFMPTNAQIAGALRQGSGIPMGSGKSRNKHWCGIFATAMLVYAGLDVRWSLTHGRIVVENKLQLKFRPGSAIDEIKAGDVAVIPRHEHHFLVRHVDRDSGVLLSVDGNQASKGADGKTVGQLIMTRNRSLKAPLADERIKYFYAVMV